MKIGIDASAAALAEKTGVARYVTRLIEHLDGLDDDNEYIVYYRLSRWKNRAYFYRPTRNTTRIRVFQEPFFWGGGLDILHGPDARLPKIRRPKLVATVHDLFSLISDEFSDERFRRRKIAQYADIARRADRIICVSQSTRSDFIRFFPEAEPKTCVIYEGVDEHFYRRAPEEIARIKRKYGIRDEYVLFVGALSKRKNVIRMCEAFLEARRALGRDIQFVLAGRATFGKEDIFRYVQENQADGGFLLTGYVPDEDLPALYSGARLFLFTTLYEGFGLPILEALACGAPVLTSDNSSMNEIARGLALTVTPASSHRIAEEMIKVLAGLHTFDPASARDILQRSRWSLVAQEVADLYLSLK